MRGPEEKRGKEKKGGEMERENHPNPTENERHYIRITGCSRKPL